MRALRTVAAVVLKSIPLFAALACLAGAGWGQTGKYGTYEGTIKISGTQTGGKTKQVKYGATIKINIPVNDGRTTSAVLDISDVSTPSATVTITQWDLEERNASPDSDGKITSWKCQLAGPATVPMMASGVLNLNHRGKNYSMFVSLVGMEEVPLKCVNSRTGPYNKAEAMGFFFGTSELDVIPPVELPLTNAARIAANHTLVPVSAMKGQYEPQQQEWELVLKK